MARAHFDEDVKPLSEFRANVSRFIERVRKTKRPIVLTQRGHSAAVSPRRFRVRAAARRGRDPSRHPPCGEATRPGQGGPSRQGSRTRHGRAAPVKIVWSPLAIERAVEAARYIARGAPRMGGPSEAVGS